MLAMALVLAASALAGCAEETGPPTYQVDEGKMGDGIAQHDVDMLAERLPVVAAADAVTYYGGWLGTPETGRVLIPNQTSMWIDAVVTLPQGLASVIALQWGATPEGDPTVVGLLDAEVPDCEFLGSYAMDEYFSGPTWFASAWICVETDQVVIAAIQP